MRPSILLLLLGLLPLLLTALACDDSTDDVNGDAAGLSDASPGPSEVGDDDAAAGDDGARPGEAGVDAGAPDLDVPPLPTRPRGAAPPDPLAGSDVESCARYRDARCEGGRQQVCDVYEPAGARFVEPDPLLRRVLLYERWYELGHAPDGQSAERAFNAATPPGTPEAEWLGQSRFERYVGYGDAAIWSGVALDAFALRYLQTGTEADYARMELKTRQLLAHFDVTGIPGYLARAHFAWVPEDRRPDPRHIYVRGGPGDHREHTFDAADVPGAPDAYRAPGVTPGWLGNPSIDQYSGPTVALPLVHDLLRDDALKGRIEHHLTCYLKRLTRIDVTNVQQNPELLDGLAQLLGGGGLRLDPDDIQFSELDSIVLYVLAQPNSTNLDTFERGCPDALPTEPARVLDVTSPTWLAEVFGLVQDFQSRDNERPDGVDHFYVPSVRAGDVIHLLHLSMLAWQWTGDPQYRRFFHEELLGRRRGLEVVQTEAALDLPDWCRSYFGGHLTYPVLWSLLSRVELPDVRAQLQRALHEEIWTRSRGPLADAKFDLVYAAVGPDPATRQRAGQRAVAALRQVGGNGGVFEDPRRAYTQAAQSVLDTGVQTRCPTPADRARCEDGLELLGLQVPGEPITGACDGGPAECRFDDGMCADAYAVEPLPPAQRQFTDFLWQRNPYAIGYGSHLEGHRQSPGLDLVEPYWMARQIGVITQGRGQVLAWRDGGACD